MRSRLWPVATTLILFASLHTGPAVAEGLLDQYAAAEKAPALLADSPLMMQVVPARKNVKGTYKWVGWSPKVQGRVIGVIGSGDAIIVDFSQKGKKLLTLRTALSGSGGWARDWEVAGNTETEVLTQTGEITATIKFYSDKEEKETQTMVRKFVVVKMCTYDDSVNQWTYGALYSDLPGFSYLVQQAPETSYKDGDRIWIYSWMQRESYNLKDISYRIEVDGKRIDVPNGFDANQNQDEASRQEQEERIFIKAKKDVVSNRYNTYLMKFIPYLFWGKRPEHMTQGISLADHPGQWVFTIKSEGKVMRELRFAVTPEGIVAPHPEQDPKRPGYLNLGPGRAFVETYFPKPNDADQRFDPEAIRKGTLFGRPWVSKEIEGMLKALPPAVKGSMVFPQPKLPPPSR